MKVYIVTKEQRDFYSKLTSIKGVFSTIEAARKYAETGCKEVMEFCKKKWSDHTFDIVTLATFRGEHFVMVNKDDKHMIIDYAIEDYELQEDKNDD